MRRLIIFAAGTLLISAVAAQAQTPLASPTTTATPGSAAAGYGPTDYADPTKNFVNDVGELDAAQRQFSTLGADKGKTKKIRDFAEEVLHEHTRGYAGLVHAEGEKDQSVAILVKLAPEHLTLLKILKSTKKNFDQTFVDFQVLLLKESLGLLKPYATGGVDPKLRQAAADAITVDRVLLDQARGIQAANPDR